MTTTLLATMLAASAILPTAVDTAPADQLLTIVFDEGSAVPLWRDILSCEKHPTLPLCS
ncbi:MULTISPECIES: hypothetical protein [Corynebacterium]|uniref:hypothetical protein n=1 Tax=Corynebacterium TaxID=1716 RepID=UPI0012EC3E76|nr:MULTISPECIES: hypothetical protein [Corynebacterium]WJY72004.1 hypothetical protein CAURIC_01640 [Corynebacterium auriscanis]